LKYGNFHIAAFIKRIVKITVYVCLSLLLLVILLLAVFRLPAIQHIIVEKIETIGQEQLGVAFEIEHLYINFPSTIDIKSFYLEDQNADSLAYLQSLKLDMNLFALLNKNVKVTNVRLNNATVKLFKNATDSTFNFQFIIDNFSNPAPDTTKQTGQSEWGIYAYGTEINNTRFVFHDSTSQTYLNVNIKQLDLDLDEADINALRFDMSNLLIDGAQVTMQVGALADDGELVDDAAAEDSTGFHLDFDRIKIRNSKFEMEDPNQLLHVTAGNLELNNGTFDLHEQVIQTENMWLAENAFNLQINRIDSAKLADQASESADTKPWKIDVREIDLQNNSGTYNVLPAPLTSGFDANHIAINKLTGNLRDIQISGTNIQSNISALGFTEKNGLELENLQTEFKLQDQALTVNNLDIATSRSSAMGDFKMNLDHFVNGNTNDSSEFQIHNAVIDPVDVQYFMPASGQLFIQAPIRISANIKGNLPGLNIKDFQVQSDSTELALRGKVNGLPELNSTKFNLPAIRLSTTSKSIAKLLPDTLLPASIQLPDTLQLAFRYTGYWHQGTGGGHVHTSSGNISLNTSHRLDTSLQEIDIEAELEMEKLYMAQILPAQKIGYVDGNIAIKGKRASLKKPEIQLNAHFDSLEYNDYNYRGLKVDGMTGLSSFNGNIDIDNDNIALNYQGMIAFSDALYQADFNLEIIHANLEALQLTHVPYKIKGTIDASMTLDTIGHLNGMVALHNMAVLRNTVYYPIDSLWINSVSNLEKTDLTLESEILSAGISGNVDLLSIPDIISRHLEKYFTMDSVRHKTEDPVAKSFDFYLEIHEQKLLTKVLVPNLEKISIAKFEGSYSEAKDELRLNIDLPMIIYAGNKLDSLSIALTALKDDLRGSLTWSKLSNDYLSVDNYQLNARSFQNKLNLTMEVPFKGRTHFKIGSNIYKEDSTYFVTFIPDDVVFSGNKWSIPEENFIGFNSGIMAKNVIFSRNDHRLSLENKVAGKDSILRLGFEAFRLENIGSALMSGDTLAEGMLNGFVELYTNKEELAMDANVKIDGLVYQNHALGDLSLNNKYKNHSNHINLALKGQHNNATLTGTFASSDTMRYNLTANIQRFELNSVERIFSDNVQKLEGRIKGKIDVNGASGSLPRMEGDLTLSDVHVIPTYLGTGLFIDQEKLVIRGGEIRLDQFTLQDVNNNTASIDGRINTSDFDNFKYDLSVNAENFLLFNTDEKDNDLYYGKILLDSKLTVKGDERRYNVNANVSIGEGTNVTFVVPVENTSVASYEDVVTFVDKDAEKDPLLEQYAIKETDTSSFLIEGMNLTANIAVNSESKLSIIVDQETGDKLELRGDANLSLKMPPSGDINLTGRYEIVDGSYNLNFYQLVKREFEIVKGSNLIWTGDMLEADLDVTTRYNIETFPPIPGSNTRMPFYVNLHIGGEILDPSLEYNIGMPEENQQKYPEVYTAVESINSEETKLNKQVFSLIVLNSFMVDRSDSDATTMVRNTARSSLSKILSQQLNKLAGNINAVNLDMNIDSYNTGAASEGRTDLQLGLSKSLFNDRVMIRVSGNVNLEGEEKSTNTASEYAGDIMIEYKLTKDGELRLQGFSVEEFDGLEQGEITKTGVGIILVKDYDQLKELFKIGNTK